MSTWSKCVDSVSVGVQLFSYPSAGTSNEESLAEPSTSEREQALEAARRDGFREGECSARRLLEEDLRKERGALSEAIKAFERERERYSRRVEPEVIRLALAIAKKILHREAQVDPLMLAGVVRSALDRIEASIAVKLRVSPTHKQKWDEVLSREHGNRVQVVADVQVRDDECRIETEVGTAEVSLPRSLEEIEQGFLDLVIQRDSAGAGAVQ